jgi:transcriptional regulator with XRE-family HTH domain
MSTASNRTTGKRIRAFRIDAGLTQLELKNASGVHENTIARLERGEHTATIPILKKLAKALNVTLDDLVD